MKKKAMSVIRIVIVILMILVIAVALVTDILFSRSETPKIFGHYIYMMETDEMELAGETADPASATAAKAAGSTTGSGRKQRFWQKNIMVPIQFPLTIRCSVS